MKKNVLETIKKGIEDNLPTILTATGVVTGLGTIGYSVYAGYKIKEIVDDEKLDKKQKRKKIIITSIPTVGGAVVSTACNILAGKENANRYAALGAMYAASKLDGDIFKQEATKIIGKDKVEEIEKNISKKNPIPSGPKNRRAHFIDQVTGYEFDTTLQAYLDAVKKFNQMATIEELPISSLYEELLGDDYTYVEMHDHVRFGIDTSSPYLSPEFDGALDDNMVPCFSVTYDYYCG